MIDAAKQANLLAIVALALAELRGKDFETRRRAVLYVPSVLGHTMNVDHVRDQPWGVVGQCVNCGQIAKAPLDDDTLDGRAIRTYCPAAR